MKITKRCFFLPFLVLSLIAGSALAQDQDTIPLDTIPLPAKKEAPVDLKNLKRARLTEDQAIDHMELMMLFGWQEINKVLHKEGEFMPFGIVMASPTGKEADNDRKIRKVVVEGQDQMNQAFAAKGIGRTLKEIAKTRSFWGVGLAYIAERPREDGTLDRRIVFNMEHIAGWGRLWSYPFKAELKSEKEVPAVEFKKDDKGEIVIGADGNPVTIETTRMDREYEIKLAKPTQKAVKPFYFEQ